MNTNIKLPVRGDLRLIYASSFLIAILLFVASIVGLLYPALIYSTEELMRTFMSNDVANLVIGFPILLGSIWLAWRGKLIGLLCWSGALFYVPYNYAAYVFAIPFNRAFPLHFTLMMLCTYTLIGLLASVDGTVVKQRLSGAVPERFAGGVLVVLGLLFLIRVVVVIVSALSSGMILTSSELAANISDYSTIPAWVIGGILLWQRKEFGYVTSLGLLFQGSMLFVAVIIFLLLQPLLASVPFPVIDLAVIFVMGLICFIPFGLIVRGVMRQPSL